MEKMNSNGAYPAWIEKYNPLPLEWNGLRVYFAVLPVSKIKMNKGQIEGLPANPRRWDKDELERLKKSIVETPELTLARGVLAYPHEDYVVALGGNMRRHSANLEPKETALPCYIYPVDTPADKLIEIVVKDNGAFGEWDMDALANEFHDKPLVAWGVPAWEQRNAEQAGNGGGEGDMKPGSRPGGQGDVDSSFAFAVRVEFKTAEEQIAFLAEMEERGLKASAV